MIGYARVRMTVLTRTTLSFSAGGSAHRSSELFLHFTVALTSNPLQLSSMTTRYNNDPSLVHCPRTLTSYPGTTAYICPGVCSDMSSFIVQQSIDFVADSSLPVEFYDVLNALTHGTGYAAYGDIFAMLNNLGHAAHIIGQVSSTSAIHIGVSLDVINAASDYRVSIFSNGYIPADIIIAPVPSTMLNSSPLITVASGVFSYLAESPAVIVPDSPFMLSTFKALYSLGRVIGDPAVRQYPHGIVLDNPEFYDLCSYLTTNSLIPSVRSSAAYLNSIGISCGLRTPMPWDSVDPITGLPSGSMSSEYTTQISTDSTGVIANRDSRNPIVPVCIPDDFELLRSLVRRSVGLSSAALPVVYDTVSMEALCGVVSESFASALAQMPVSGHRLGISDADIQADLRAIFILAIMRS